MTYKTSRHVGLLSGYGRSVLLYWDRGGKMVEVTERGTDIDSTKAAIEFYQNVKANTNKSHFHGRRYGWL